ncbi:MAG TPA: HEAT repeat domain-containing protein [Opitutales bacterium]|jgi:HEAT repeat protein|nr:HEAT repeat domain-containing protein [Opitutales bacterium]
MNSHTWVLLVVGITIVAGSSLFIANKGKYLKIAVWKLMNKTYELKDMYIDERDRDVARAAKGAMEKTRKYDYFVSSSAHSALLGKISDWALKGDVDNIATMLGETDTVILKAAENALGKLVASKKHMVNGYLGVLSSSAESYIKTHAIDKLGDLGDKRALKPLVGLLKHGDRDICSHATDALEKLGAGEKLILDANFNALSSKDLNVRYDAVRRLVDFGDKRAIEPLLVMLEDSDERIRSFAAASLPQLGASKEQMVNGYIAILFSKTLKRDLNDEFRFTRTTALEILINAIDKLGGVGDMNAIKPLLGLLKHEELNVRSSAAKALGKLSVSKEQMVNGYLDVISSSRISEVAIYAMEKLGDLRDKRAIMPLLRFLKHEDRGVRSTAEKVLTVLDASNEVIDFYLDLLKSQPRSSGYSVILDYFVQTKSSRPVYPLIELIHQPQPGFENFYKDILKAIGKIGDRNAIAPLNQLLNSRWKWVTVDDKGRPTGIVKETGSEWIREDILSALRTLDGN